MIDTQQNNKMLRLAITDIQTPQKGSHKTWQKKYYSVYIGWSNWMLFSQHKKAKAWEAAQNRKINELSKQISFVSSQLYAWYKGSDYITYDELRYLADCFTWIEQGHAYIYKPWNNWQSVIPKLKKNLEHLVNIYKILDNRGAHLTAATCRVQLEYIEHELTNFGTDTAEKVLKYSETGTPQIIDIAK
jgi:hypothetical protein